MSASAMHATHKAQRRTVLEEEMLTRVSILDDEVNSLEQIPRRHEMRLENHCRSYISSCEKQNRIQVLKILNQRAEWNAKWDSLFNTLLTQEGLMMQKLMDEEGLGWLAITDLKLKVTAEDQLRKRLEAERRQREIDEYYATLDRERREVDNEDRDARQVLRNEEALIRSQFRNMLWSSYNETLARERSRIEREQAEFEARCIAEQIPYIDDETETRGEIITEEGGAFSGILALFAQLQEDLMNPILITMQSTSCTHVLNSNPVPLLSGIKVQRKPFTAQHQQLVANACVIISFHEGSAFAEDILDLPCIEISSIKERIKGVTGLRLLNESLYDDDNVLLGAVQKSSSQCVTIKSCGPDANLFSNLEKILRHITFRTDSVCMLSRVLQIKICANFVKEQLTPRSKKAKQQAFYSTVQPINAFGFENNADITVACIPPIFFLPPDRRTVNFDVRRKQEGQKLFVTMLDGLKIDSTSCHDYRNGTFRMKSLEGYVKEDNIGFASNESICVKKGEVWCEDTIIGKITQGKLYFGPGSTSSKEFTIQFEDTEISPAFLERFISRFQFTTTNTHAEPNRRIYEIMLQEGPHSNRMSNCASLAVEVAVFAMGETNVDINVSEGEGIKFYRVSSTTVPPQLASYITQKPCRLMPSAVVSSMSIVKFNSAQCKIAITSGRSDYDSLTLDPSPDSCLRAHASVEGGLISLRYVSGVASYALGTAQCRDGVITIEFFDGDCAALQAVLRSVMYTPTGQITFACLKTLVIELNIPDNVKKKTSLFKAQMGVFVSRPSVFVPYSKCFVGLARTDPLQLFDAISVSKDGSNYLHFDGGRCTVEVLEGDDNDFLDLYNRGINDIPTRPDKPEEESSEGSNAADTNDIAIMVNDDTTDLANTDELRHEESRKDFSKSSSSGDESEEEEDKEIPPTEFELMGLVIVKSENDPNLHSVMYKNNVVATYRPGPKLVIEFSGKKKGIIPIGVTPHAITNTIVSAILNQIGYRQIEEQAVRRIISFTLEDMYGGESNCICELNVLPGSEMTEIIFSCDKLTYRANDPAVVKGVLLLMPDTVLEDDDTTNVEEGYLVVEPLTDVTTDDVLTVVSTSSIRVDEMNQTIWIGEEQAGKFYLSPITRALTVNFTYGLSLEDCALIFRGVGYKNLSEFPKKLGERIFLVGFNAGDGAEDSRVQLTLNVQKPMLWMLPMFRSIKYTEGFLGIIHTVQVSMPTATALAGGYVEAFISIGFCEEEDVISFQVPKNFSLSENNELEVEISAARQIMEQLVVPTIGYSGLLIGTLKQEEHSFRLEFSRLCSLNSKFIPHLLRCIKYNNIGETPKLHTRQVTVSLHVPTMGATSSLISEIEVTGTDDMTEIELGKDKCGCFCQDGPLHLFPEAVVDDNDTPVFHAPFSFISVEITAGATLTDAISVVPFKDVEFNKETGDLIYKNTVVGKLDTTVPDLTKKISFRLEACPLEALSEVLGMYHFEVKESVDKVTTSFMMIECTGGENCAVTRVRFEVQVVPRPLTAFNNGIYKTTLNDVTSQADIFPHSSNLVADSYGGLEVTVALWTIPTELPGDPSFLSRPLVPSYDRLVLKLPGDLILNKGAISDKATSVRICNITFNEQSATISFVKSTRAVRTGIHVSILRALVFECKEGAISHSIEEATQKANQAKLLVVNNNNLTGTFSQTASPRRSMQVPPTPSAGGIPRKKNASALALINTCGTVVCEITVKVPLEEEFLQTTIHTLIDVPKLV
eukprot:PhF_6_TR26638/c0_g1_i1/m.38582